MFSPLPIVLSVSAICFQAAINITDTAFYVRSSQPEISNPRDPPSLLLLEPAKVIDHQSLFSLMSDAADTTNATSHISLSQLECAYPVDQTFLMPDRPFFLVAEPSDLKSEEIKLLLWHA